MAAIQPIRHLSLDINPPEVHPSSQDFRLSNSSSCPDRPTLGRSICLQSRLRLQDFSFSEDIDLICPAWLVRTCQGSRITTSTSPTLPAHRTISAASRRQPSIQTSRSITRDDCLLSIVYHSLSLLTEQASIPRPSSARLITSVNTSLSHLVQLDINNHPQTNNIASHILVVSKHLSKDGVSTAYLPCSSAHLSSTTTISKRCSITT